MNELMDDNNYIIIHKLHTDKKIWIGFEYKYKNYNIYINNKLGIKQIIIMDEYSLDNIIMNEYPLNN